MLLPSPARSSPVAGADDTLPPWFTVRPPEKHDRDAGGDGHGSPLIHGETAGEDVAEVGRGLRADRVQRQRLAADDRVRLDVDALEPQVVGRRVLHVDGGDVQRRVEAVADQVARVEHDAVGEVDLADGEGAAAGLEVPAGVDDDLGVVAAVGVVPRWR